MKEARRVFPVETNPTGPLPLLIGLEGPPGAGKTYSALRLARGIQQVRPGPIRLIDTEVGRSGAYRAQVDFGLVNLGPPYRPSRFLSCINELIAVDSPAVIIVDSLSDEHEGKGGVLDWHDEEVTRRVGKGNEENWAMRERHSMAAWIVPKADRKQLINGLLHILTPIICTFRAREKTKPIRDPKTGKMVPTQMGYVAIAPAEIIFNLTCMCLLPPNANGKPTWRSEEAEGFLLKRPIFLADALTDAQLDETTGAKLAKWAQGVEKPPVKMDTTPGHMPDDDEKKLMEAEAIDAIQVQAREAALHGKAALRKFCQSLTKEKYNEAVRPIGAELAHIVAGEDQPA